MHRRSRTLLAPLLLAACGPSDAQAAGAVLFFAPFVYLVALLFMAILHATWLPIVPDVKLGRGSHYVALALLTGPAIHGAYHADVNLIGAVFAVFGACMLAWWLVLARLTLRSGWGFRWGGLVAAGLLVAPLQVGMLQPELLQALLGQTVRIYLYTGALGLVPAVLLIGMLIEGGRAVRAVERGKASPSSM